MSVFVDNTYKRVEKLITLKGLKINSFEEKIQVSNNSIGTAIRRKASFKSNVLNKILNSFPDVNPTWLLTGRGDMFLNVKTNRSLNESTDFDNSVLKLQIKTTLTDLLINDDDVNKVLKEQVIRAKKK